MTPSADLSGIQLSRDLRWIQSSPVLFNDTCHECFASSVLPECSSPLFEPGYALAPEAVAFIRNALEYKRWHLLGIYYETLWHYLLDQHPAIHTLARNLQVQKADHSTLGEFDLIYNNLNTGITTHLELAVKFYLGIPEPLQHTNSSHWHQWVGPGLKDRMDRKLHQLLSHQIRLARTPEGAAAVASLGVTRLSRTICLQGYLFYPIHGYCPPPQNCNPDHLKGYWIAESMLNDWLEQQPSGLYYFRPAKLRWLASLHESESQKKNDKSSLLQSLAGIREPQLIIACAEEANGYNEQYRFFVVPDDWQQRAELASEKQQ